MALMLTSWVTQDRALAFQGPSSLSVKQDGSSLRVGEGTQDPGAEVGDMPGTWEVVRERELVPWLGKQRQSGQSFDRRGPFTSSPPTHGPPCHTPGSRLEMRPLRPQRDLPHPSRCAGH